MSITALRFVIAALCLICLPRAHAEPPTADVLPPGRFEYATPGLALDAALGDLLRDVVQELPRRRQLYDPEAAARRAALTAACREDEHCEYVLTKQFEALVEYAGTLAGSLATAGPDLEQRGQQLALAISAADELCLAADAAQRWLFRVCGNAHQIGYAAARTWFELGNEPLALALRERAESSNHLTLQWLANAEMSEEERQSRINDIADAKKSGPADAGVFEALDDVAAARVGALMALAALPADSVPLDKAVQVAHLARLSARLGDVDASMQWLRALDTLPLADAQRRNCLLRQPLLRTQIARARAERSHFDALSAMQELDAGGCALPVIGEEQAIAALHLDDAATASAVLDYALAACTRQGRCMSAARERLVDLQAVARRDRVAMGRLATAWLARLEQETLTGREREFVWVLARGLFGTDGAQLAQGSALLDRLDDTVSLARQNLVGLGAAGTQQNLARYEDLKRLRLLGRFRAGNPVQPSDSEVLRSQRLLERLRRQRWARDLAQVDVPAARSERDAQQAQLAQWRQQLLALPAGDAFGEALRTAALGMADDAVHVIDDSYLDALANAAQKFDSHGYQGLGLGSLAQTDRFATGLVDDSGLVAGHEAYLSFLRVPGGYLATIVRGASLLDHESGDSAPLRNRFIAVNAAQERTLALWRDILRTGGAVTRGKRGIQRPGSAAGAHGTTIVDTGGVVLEGVPVWRLADGAYAALASAPPGAVRARQPAEIGDSLYALLLEPFQREFQDALRLVVSPDGALALLPFETLSRHGVPVTELTDIVYVQSLAIYSELKNRKPGASGAPADTRQPGHEAGLFSMADPVYLAGVDPLDWQPLPGTRRESAQLAALYPGSTRLLGADAERRHLLALNEQGTLRKFGLLHFAMHGYTDAQRSALVLSNAAGAKDSYFTDADVATLSLASSLTLLSACDTGIGRVVSGDGVVGLPYAFFMAGNRNTLMSLWPVDDAGTAAFMPAYVERLRAGQDIASALNDTKRAFARGEHGEAFRDPRIWAAFVLYGVAEPLVAPSLEPRR